MKEILFLHLRVEKIPPPLHKKSSFIEIFGMIVGCPHPVALHVGELALNCIPIESPLVEGGGK